jgi:hypothetical protein
MKIDHGRVAVLLGECETLAQAEGHLAQLDLPIPVRWGLWDGWSGRPRVLSGIVPDPKYQEPHHKKIAKDYAEACEIGAKLALARMAA